MQELSELVLKWTKGKGLGFIMDSGYYAGRGPTQSDLNSKLLEAFYDGIKKDVGEKEAKNFVRFVNKLDDLSASAFIVAFEQFAARKYKIIDIKQKPEDGNRLTAHGPGLEAQAFALIAGALAGPKRSPAENLRASETIKYAFINKHQKEISANERRSARAPAYSF